MPGCAAVVYDDRLWGLMPYIEASCNGIGQSAIFNDKDQTTGQVAQRFRKSCELFVDVGAYGALRAMLENDNGIGF